MKVKEINEEDWKKALKMAKKVDFLEKGEILAYAKALYSAMEWGRQVK